MPAALSAIADELAARQSHLHFARERVLAKVERRRDMRALLSAPIHTDGSVSHAAGRFCMPHTQEIVLYAGVRLVRFVTNSSQ